MKTVWKYEFDVEDRFELEMPVGAKIVHVALQLFAPCFWAEVETTSAKEIVVFSVFGTGHPIPDMGVPNHVGTFQEGPFVWHLYRWK